MPRTEDHACAKGQGEPNSSSIHKTGITGGTKGVLPTPLKKINEIKLRERYPKPSNKKGGKREKRCAPKKQRSYLRGTYVESRLLIKLEKKMGRKHKNGRQARHGGGEHNAQRHKSANQEVAFRSKRGSWGPKAIGEKGTTTQPSKCAFQGQQGEGETRGKRVGNAA